MLAKGTSGRSGAFYHRNSGRLAFVITDDLTLRAGKILCDPMHIGAADNAG